MTFDYAAESNRIIQELTQANALGQLHQAIPVDYSAYVLKVRQQQQKRPNHPKIEPLLSDSFQKPQKDEAVALKEVLNESYTYVGTRKLSGTLYYEFARVDSPTLAYETYRFLYISVTPANTQALIAEEKLPRLLSWDTQQFPSLYPTQCYLVSAGINNWPDFYTINTADATHPFLPGFYFTGRTSIQRNGTAVYEYFDSAGLYGATSDIYVSTLRPIPLDFPLGHPRFGELEYDYCLESAIGQYPAKGNASLTGTFTGYRTSIIYCPYKSYYLYERSDKTAFLLDSPPHPIAQDVMEQTYILNGIATPQISFVEQSGEQTLSINQYSTPTDLILEGL